MYSSTLTTVRPCQRLQATSHRKKYDGVLFSNCSRVCGNVVRWKICCTKSDTLHLLQALCYWCVESGYNAAHSEPWWGFRFSISAGYNSIRVIYGRCEASLLPNVIEYYRKWLIDDPLNRTFSWSGEIDAPQGPGCHSCGKNPPLTGIYLAQS